MTAGSGGVPRRKPLGVSVSANTRPRIGRTPRASKRDAVARPTCTRTGSPLPRDSVIAPGTTLYAPIASAVDARSRHARYAPLVIVPRIRPCCPFRISVRRTTRSGSGHGSGFISRP